MAGRGPPCDAGTMRVWAGLATIYVVWGSTYLGIRVMVETVPPLLGSGLRFLVAGAIFAAVLVARRGVAALRVSRRELLSCAIVAVSLLAGEGGDVHWSAISADSALAFAYLVVAGSLGAFTAYVWLLGHAPLSQVATYAYVNPVVAIALGALILGEHVTALVVVGAAIIVASVAMTVRREAVPRRARSATSSAPAPEPAG